MAVSPSGDVALLHHGVANALSTADSGGQSNGCTRMHFGQITAVPTVSAITIDHLGNIDTAEHQAASNSGAHSLGRFHIVGKDGQYVDVSLPEAGFKVRHADGADEINIDLVAYNVPSMLVGGLGVFNVGGELSLAGNQVPGIYVGNYTVTVTYS